MCLSEIVDSSGLGLYKKQEKNVQWLNNKQHFVQQKSKTLVGLGKSMKKHTK